MAALDDVSSVDKVFSNGAPRDEPSLVWVDKKRNQNSKTKGETLGMNFETTVLEGDRTKGVRAVGARLFW
jgi:hypothetical protein